MLLGSCKLQGRLGSSEPVANEFLSETPGAWGLSLDHRVGKELGTRQAHAARIRSPERSTVHLAGLNLEVHCLLIFPRIPKSFCQRTVLQAYSSDTASHAAPPSQDLQDLQPARNMLPPQWQGWGTVDADNLRIAFPLALLSCSRKPRRLPLHPTRASNDACRSQIITDNELSTFAN